MSRQILSRLCILSLAAIIFAGCQPGSPSVDVNAQITVAVQTALASIQQTKAAATPSPTETPVPTPTVAAYTACLAAYILDKITQSTGYTPYLYSG